MERSGLKEYFAAVEIVSEKNVPTYRSVISKYGLHPDASWMIGNSPKSDINPALAAGLNAVFVPHGATWVLEHEEVDSAEPPRQVAGGGEILGVANALLARAGSGETEQHKVPPLRSLRFAPVGMTGLFG